MEDKFIPEKDEAVPNESVQNFFKNGRKPTPKEYTQVWVDLINQIERMKADQ